MNHYNLLTQEEVLEVLSLIREKRQNYLVAVKNDTLKKQLILITGDLSIFTIDHSWFKDLRNNKNRKLDFENISISLEDQIKEYQALTKEENKDEETEQKPPFPSI